MNQHSSQQTNLDFLVPNHIIDHCRFDRFTLDLRLIGTLAVGDSPTVRIKVQNKIIFDGPIDSSEELSFKTSIDLLNVNEVPVEIEYYGKNFKHTTVDQQGNIIENQMVKLDKIVINDIDLIKTKIIYELGNYTFVLDSEKEKYYREHNLSIEPNHSLEMAENGKWKLIVPVPVLTGFCKIKSFQDPHEKWPDPELMEELFNRIKRVRNLKSKLNELPNNGN